ncbi:universal stress protein [Streptomyces inhibens]|uniref:universal stress protein n=1 Tax=Streptomyces inhibens TaxID=2293571 RepID=UPI001EE7682A|nr:universal stress protein [Streptomyces inhibens]UKY47912.1 universal stress protein [Streptomyces inhibens]
MATPLVVGTDGSADALHAVDWAADEAALRGCPLRLLYASLWARYEASALSVGGRPRAQRASAAWSIAAAAEERARARRPEVAVTADVCEEDPVYALLDASDRAAAIIVGSRGHGLSGIILGSVSLTVAARARCPVIVVRGDAPGATRERWVVLGLGTPGTTTAAVDFAFTEAALRGCGVEVVHAWTRPRRESATVRAGEFDETRLSHEQQAKRWLDEALARPTAMHPDVPVRRVVVENRARPALLQAAAAADLLVVGARRRRDALALQLGLVNHAMLHYAQCNIAIVPAEGSAD